MEGMTSPKPGPIKEPSTSTAHSVSSQGDGLGNDMGDDSDWFAPHGNPDKGMLGGDNRTDLGLMAVMGNPAPGAVMSHDYGWQGDKPLFASGGNCTREELKSYFRGGSDKLGMDGRDDGT